MSILEPAYKALRIGAAAAVLSAAGALTELYSDMPAGYAMAAERPPAAASAEPSKPPKPGPENAGLKVEKMPSPNFRKASGRKVKYIVLHTTEGSFDSAASWLRNPKSRASSHYIVGRDGKVAELVNPDYVAWHVHGHNSGTIGIEMEGTFTEPITDEETTRVGQLVLNLSKKYGIPPENIVSHSSLDPQRRKDPGEENMKKIRDYVAAHMAGSTGSSLQAQGQKTAAGHYEGFSFQDEIGIIEALSKSKHVDPALVMAIRESEKGLKGREYGIMPTGAYEKDKTLRESDGTERPYKSGLEKQAAWCAGTIRRNMERFKSLPPGEREKYTDFIDFLGDRYSPVGRGDDNGSNKNWKPNVRSHYREFSSGKN